MADPDRRQVVIGTLAIHDMNTRETEEAITRWLAEPGPARLVCTPNVDHVVKAQRNRAFLEAVLSCDLRVPDGRWIVYASRLAGRPLRSSITGRLLLPSLAAHCRDFGFTIALVGAGPGVAAAAAERLRRDLSGLQVSHAITPPPDFVVGSAADDAIVAKLSETPASIIFVALGAPKQEMWMARHREQLQPAVLIGVGQALDVVAGRVREAPHWMTRIGLEWAFRLAQEPRRLARRYLLDDPWIFWWALRTRLGRE